MSPVRTQTQAEAELAVALASLSKARALNVAFRCLFDAVDRDQCQHGTPGIQPYCACKEGGMVHHEWQKVRKLLPA